MSDSEQVQHFGNELDKLVDRFRSEYDLTMASAVGVLNFKAFLLMREAQERQEEDEEPDDPRR